MRKRYNETDYTLQWQKGTYKQAIHYNEKKVDWNKQMCSDSLIWGIPCTNDQIVMPGTM